MIGRDVPDPKRARTAKAPVVQLVPRAKRAPEALESLVETVTIKVAAMDDELGRLAPIIEQTSADVTEIKADVSEIKGLLKRVLFARRRRAKR